MEGREGPRPRRSLSYRSCWSEPARPRYGAVCGRAPFWEGAAEAMKSTAVVTRMALRMFHSSECVLSWGGQSAVDLSVFPSSGVRGFFWGMQIFFYQTIESVLCSALLLVPSHFASLVLTKRRKDRKQSEGKYYFPNLVDGQGVLWGLNWLSALMWAPKSIAVNKAEWMRQKKKKTTNRLVITCS